MVGCTVTDMAKAIETMKMDSSLRDTNAINKCIEYCQTYNYSATELLAELDAFITNANTNEVSLAVAQKFEQHLIANKKTRTPDVSVLGKRGTDSATKHTTPDLSILENSFSQANVIPYGAKSPHGQLTLTLNPNLGPRETAFPYSDLKPLGMRCRVNVSEPEFNNINERYRFMFTTLEERVRALDKHLFELQNKMCAMANIDPETVQNVAIPSQDAVWVCGRIVNEATEGKINAESVLLEGASRADGRRVKLNLVEVPSYSLFPGQIVMVYGICSDGKHMVAKRILEGHAAEPQASLLNKLKELHHDGLYQGGKPLSVMTAAGPFTTSDNLKYEPFNDLLFHALKQKPDVLILIGPFVDVTQPLLASGDVQINNPVDDDETAAAADGMFVDSGSGGKEQQREETHAASYEMVFVEKIIRDGLGTYFRSEGEEFGRIPTQILLIPSLNDAHHEYVFPQPPFGDRDKIETEFFDEPLGVLEIPFTTEGPKKRVHLLPNPCMFRVNEVLFGVTSNDVLFSLSAEEISARMEGNRVVRLGNHILNQRSFCPQFPLPTNMPSQLDFRHAKSWEFSLKPDILILPSRLGGIAKDIQGTLLVNPGTLTKGVGGGTFAELHIHPFKEEEIQMASIDKVTVLPHNVPARTYVNIVKI